MIEANSPDFRLHKSWNNQKDFPEISEDFSGEWRKARALLIFYSFREAANLYFLAVAKAPIIQITTIYDD